MTEAAEGVDVAREYYNSADADNFYAVIWGGEDIHVGLYDTSDEPIFDASRRTVERIAAKADRSIGPETAVLDIGAGFGGAARYLAATYGCRVTALNLSEAENERDRTMNAEQGLDHLVTVVDGSFDDIPDPDESYDLVWCQDSILHIADRRKVIAEVFRVLKPEGEFLFTDPMQADDCPDGVLDPILARIHLPSMGSPRFYLETARELGFVDVEYEDHSQQLPRHYGRVLEETTRREGELHGLVSPEYVERMKTGLRHWVEGGEAGHLAWGIFHFRKPS